MSQQQQWEETLKRLLRRGKVSTAAVLDAETFQPLATLPHLPITFQQGEGLVKAATCGYPCAFKLQFAGTCFTCFNKDKNSLLGCAEGSVLVGVKSRDVVLVGMADSESPGSCLYEVTEFCKRLRKSERNNTKKQRQSVGVNAGGVRKVVGSGS